MKTRSRYFAALPLALIAAGCGAIPDTLIQAASDSAKEAIAEQIDDVVDEFIDELLAEFDPTSLLEGQPAGE